MDCPERQSNSDNREHRLGAVLPLPHQPLYSYRRPKGQELSVNRAIHIELTIYPLSGTFVPFPNQTPHSTFLFEQFFGGGLPGRRDSKLSRGACFILQARDSQIVLARTLCEFLFCRHSRVIQQRHSAFIAS